MNIEKTASVCSSKERSTTKLLIFPITALFSLSSEVSIYAKYIKDIVLQLELGVGICLLAIPTVTLFFPLQCFKEVREGRRQIFSLFKL